MISNGQLLLGSYLNVPALLTASTEAALLLSQALAIASVIVLSSLSLTRRYTLSFSVFRKESASENEKSF